MTEQPNEPFEELGKERTAVIDKAASHRTMQTLVFFGDEPYVAFVARDTAPATSHPRPNETIVFVEWASEYVGYPETGWAVGMTTAGDRKTSPEWEYPEDPEETFDDRAAAVEYAYELLRDSS